MKIFRSIRSTSAIRNSLSKGQGSLGLSAYSFSFYFTGHPALLFTFPSRYWSTIGLRLYLALEDGPPRFPRSICIEVLGIPLELVSSFVYAAVTLYGRPFQIVPLPKTSLILRSHNPPTAKRPSKFGLFRFRSPLLTESRLPGFHPTEHFDFSSSSY